MVRSAIKVVLRPRPTAQWTDALEVGADRSSVSLTLKRRQDVGVVNHQQETFAFQFDTVLHNSSQEQVFEACGRDAVDSALEGFNATVLAYGQTGAGKTFTMTGGKDSYKHRGLIPRCLSYVYRELGRKPDLMGVVRISYAEIYNESFIDLLNPTTEPGEISVMEDAKGGVLVKGLSSHVAANEEEALGLHFEGESNRAIAEHQLNKMSSRSHTIFTVSLELSGRSPESTEQVVVSKINLVDLAGSERLSKTGSEGTVAKEAQHINKSLSFLEQVIIALGSKNRDHIPYRSSKLTHMLKDSLGGNCKTMMVANVWAEAAHLEETLSTCKFAQRMQRLVNEVSRNVRDNPSMANKRLEREVRELKQELAMHDQFASRGSMSYDPYGDEQRTTLREQVRKFLEGSDTTPGSVAPLELLSLRHMKEILFQCRSLYQSASARAAAGGVAAGSRPVTPALAAPAAPDYAEDEGVGDLEGDPAFAVGCAPDDARPPEALRVQAADNHRRQLAESAAEAAGPPGTPPEPVQTKSEAYDEYKKGKGAELFRMTLENKQALKERKRQIKELAQGINTLKYELDATKEHADKLRAQRPGPDESGAEVMDEEEYQALLRMKELKRQYREKYEEHKMLKSEADYTSKLAEQCTQNLLIEFEKWYAETYGAAAAAAPALSPAARQRQAIAAAPAEQDPFEAADAAAASRAALEAEDPDAAAYLAAQRTQKTRTLKAGGTLQQRGRSTKPRF